MQVVVNSFIRSLECVEVSMSSKASKQGRVMSRGIHLARSDEQMTLKWQQGD